MSLPACKNDALGAGAPQGISKFPTKALHVLVAFFCAEVVSGSGSMDPSATTRWPMARTSKTTWSTISPSRARSLNALPFPSLPFPAGLDVSLSFSLCAPTRSFLCRPCLYYLRARCFPHKTFRHPKQLQLGATVAWVTLPRCTLVKSSQGFSLTAGRAGRQLRLHQLRLPALLWGVGPGLVP